MKNMIQPHFCLTLKQKKPIGHAQINKKAENVVSNYPGAGFRGNSHVKAE